MSPLFRRRPAEPDQPPDALPPPPPPPLPVRGSDRCFLPDCGRTDAAPCSYVDRRGRPCGTSWCPLHQSIFEGRPYCRRHAGTLLALGDVGGEGLLPELQNRAPTLVHWVARDMDADIRMLLQQVQTGHEDLVAETNVRLIPAPTASGAKRWERSWKLLDHTGFALKIGVEVDETAELPEIVVRVKHHEVMREVPPWILHHIRGEQVDREQDRAERVAFYQRMHDRIAPDVQPDHWTPREVRPTPFAGAPAPFAAPPGTQEYGEPMPPGFGPPPGPARNYPDGLRFEPGAGGCPSGGTS